MLALAASVVWGVSGVEAIAKETNYVLGGLAVVAEGGAEQAVVKYAKLSMCFEIAEPTRRLSCFFSF